MNPSRTILSLFALLALAIPAHAAQLSLETPLAAAGTPFSIPVVLTTEQDAVNAVQGAISVPEGVVIDSVDTAGSSFTLFATGPRYVPASHSIEFTAGTPGGLPEGTVALVFVIRAHAEVPGSYEFAPQDITAYANDGKGTPVAVAVGTKALAVGPSGSASEEALREAAPSPLYAEIGRDESLFDGTWFVTFFGGASGSSVDHYEVREGWWRAPARADRYYVLKDQDRSSTVWVTAVSDNGKKVTASIPAANPWTERGVALVLVLVVATVGGLIWRRFFRRTIPI